MASLVNLAQAKAQLMIPHTTTDRDVEVQELADRASGTIVRLCGDFAVAGWSDGTVAVPSEIEIATLLLVAQLDRYRGDEPSLDGGWYHWVVSYRGHVLA